MSDEVNRKARAELRAVAKFLGLFVESECPECPHRISEAAPQGGTTS